MLLSETQPADLISEPLPFDSSTLQPIMWDGNAGGLEGHLHQLDDWTDESKLRQLMSTGVTTTSGGKTICVNADILNIVETEREIVAAFPERFHV